jgi:hypothetical protein
MPQPPHAELPPIERVVTGHRLDGAAHVTSKGPLPSVHRLEAIPCTVFHEVWSTAATPAPVDNGNDPTLGALALAPPRHGTRIRFVDIPPDSEDFLRHGAASMKAAFAEIGDEKASTVRADSPHPLMHRTESIDYGILIQGELILILDDELVVLRPGSVVVQRGTNHAWANRSGQMARMAFVLIDGAFAPEIAESLRGAEWLVSTISSASRAGPRSSPALVAGWAVRSPNSSAPPARASSCLTATTPFWSPYRSQALQGSRQDLPGHRRILSPRCRGLSALCDEIHGLPADVHVGPLRAALPDGRLHGDDGPDRRRPRWLPKPPSSNVDPDFRLF